MRDDSARAFHARAIRKKETRRRDRGAKCVRVRLHARVRARGCIGGMDEADRREEKERARERERDREKILSRLVSKGSFTTEILNYNAAGSLV